MRSVGIGRCVDLTREVSARPGISRDPAQFAGTASRFGSFEVGQVHLEGSVHIPFPHPAGDEPLAQDAAAEHLCASNTGKATLKMCSEDDLPHAVWLMRLFYMRYALKQAEHTKAVAAPGLKTLLEPFARQRVRTRPRRRRL